ncbi:hypothetical protein JYU14_00575 [Simkania negevensis]|uniref:Uncharacterized protein n=1 Tax=Simkania negevensis TaxID=83561 RepID=A0ABS3ASH6_9BACT|nr:hypothetical protein [Simkania negevensis]
MVDIIAFDIGELDIDALSDELDILVPKYLEAINDLIDTRDLKQIPHYIHNIEVYWNRLSMLIEQLEAEGIGSPDLHSERTLQEGRQKELGALEEVYLMLNKRIKLGLCCWVDGLLDASESVLSRMDRLLEELDFEDDHRDRRLIRQLKEENRKLYRQTANKQQA